MQRALKTISGAVAAAAGIYGGYVAITYIQFGRVSGKTEQHPLLDRLMPDMRSANVILSAWRRQRRSRSMPQDLIPGFGHRADDLRTPGVAWAALGWSRAPTGWRPLFDEVIALGWRELAETPGHHVIMGAVTQPWRQEVHFRGLPAKEFVGFREPGYAKIAWTIEVEPTGPSSSVFSTETRVITTDPLSRERFRRYWAFLSPGILIIRYEILRLVRAEAERQFTRLSLIDHGRGAVASRGVRG